MKSYEKNFDRRIHDTSWMDHARCRGDDRFVYSEDDETHREVPASHELEAVAVCATCPVSKLCLAWVDPVASGYSGVAAGKIYRDGGVIHAGS